MVQGESPLDPVDALPPQSEECTCVVDQDVQAVVAFHEPFREPSNFGLGREIRPQELDRWVSRLSLDGFHRPRAPRRATAHEDHGRAEASELASGHLSDAAGRARHEADLAAHLAVEGRCAGKTVRAVFSRRLSVAHGGG